MHHCDADCEWYDGRYRRHLSFPVTGAPGYGTMTSFRRRLKIYESLDAMTIASDRTSVRIIVAATQPLSHSATEHVSLRQSFQPVTAGEEPQLKARKCQVIATTVQRVVKMYEGGTCEHISQRDLMLDTDCFNVATNSKPKESNTSDCSCV